MCALGACALDLTGTLAVGGGGGDAGVDATTDAGPDAAGDATPGPDGGGDGGGGTDAAPDARVDGGADGGGVCALSDGGAGITCAGACVDPSNDHEHCGGCSPCAAAAACESGACVDVAISLAAFRYEQPCTSAPTPYCATGGGGSRAITLTGTTGKTYELAIHVRGVVEQKTYNASTDGNATGTNASFFLAGGNPKNDLWNVFSLTVSAPSSTAYFNSGASGHTYSDGIDYHATIRAAAGASVTLSGDPVDALEAPNVDQQQPGRPIVIPGIPPAPNPFDGQFLQLDVESVKTVP